MKIIIMKGLPASGKSTRAKQLVEKSGYAYKRINKDDIRAMLDNSHWSNSNEKFVLKTRDTLINLALSEGKSVIVDDTNLHPKHEVTIRQIAKDYNAEVKVEFVDTPLEECIKRDLKRPNSVGEKVIRDMYNRYLKPKTEPIQQDDSLPEAVIVDIDGTVAEMNGRSPYDWMKVGTDLPRKNVIQIVEALHNSGMNIVFVTGRDGVCYNLTKKWIKEHVNIGQPELYSRGTGDSRSDAIIKKEILEDLVKKYYITNVLDDRDRVVEMWRSLGLSCLQVNYGDF